ncbi:MAG: phosphopantetheine adenylyltransferase [Candidatus Thorarchaeota archaeon]
MSSQPYKWAAIGGTFDRLHKGHKTLLRRAFELGKNVLIGLTTQDMVKHKPDWEIIASYDDRKSELESWLDSEGYNGRYIIRPLHDKFGPAISMSELELIVVSEETCPVAKEINEIRNEDGLSLLHIAVLTMVMAEDHTSISSTRIRAGLIDRDGRVIYHEVESP